MSLARGAKLVPYEILDPLGAGGMGEVYKARDARLERTVAIKVLPAQIAAHPEARQRLEREARAVSALNHPHICTLYDVGEQNGVDFLVLEYLEGETLGARLKKGPLPVDAALRYAIEIAGALDRAHRSAIVHRDLKPGNIMLTKSGTKLLDFGLAKIKEAAKKGNDEATAALTRDLTNPGTILGTFQYMSPEQVEGKDADARSDLFAFGAVIFEMLTGRRAFDGASQASLIAAVLRADPPSISSMQALAPPAIDRVVRTCLAKDPDERWQSAGDLARELKWIAETGVQAEAQSPPVKRGALSPWIATAVASLAAVAGFWLYLRQPVAESRSIRFTVPTQARLASDVRISPDGATLAFIGQNAEGQIVVWIRALDKLEARVLPGTTGAAYPFWSPDSRHLGYLDRARGKLMRIDPAGGQPQILCDAPLGYGGDWNADGTIIFAPNAASGIHRVSANGGVPVRITDPGTPSQTHLFPRFLPDGKHFLYLFAAAASGGVAANKPAVMVGSLDSKEVKPLIETRYPAMVSAPVANGPAHLLFVRDGILMSQEMDLNSLQLRAEPLRVADSVATDVNHSFADFSVSRTGTLALNSGLPQNEIIWIDRAGNRLGRGIPADRYSHPVLSATGKLAIFERMDSKTGSSGLWKLDVDRAEISLFAANAMMPVFFRDGSAVLYRCTLGGKPAFCRKAAGGAGPEEKLAQPEGAKAPVDFSPDGRFLSYIRDSPRPGVLNELWILPLVGDRKAFAFYPGDKEEEQGKFSPDGKWIAYSSYETGEAEAYVQPFPPTGEKWKISVRGGGETRWRADGKEIFYRTEDGKMMAVTVKTAGGFEAGVPHMLFPSTADPLYPNLAIPYDVTADGQKFLVNEAVDGNRISPITIVTHWTAAVGR